MDDRFHVSAKAVIVHEEKILLIKYDEGKGPGCDPHYNLPGGKMRANETAEEALIRKVKGESGGTVDSVGRLAFIYEYIGSNHEFIAGDKHSVSLIFYATLKDYTEPSMETCTDPDVETPQIDVCWIPIENLDDIILWPRINQRLKQVCKDLENEKENLYWGDIL